MHRRHALGLTTVLLGLVGILRQRREATLVRAGTLANLGPDGESGRPVVLEGLHEAIAAWRPRPRAAGTLGTLASVAWTGPGTLVGVVVALLGGRLPRIEADHACLVAAPVTGPTAAALRGVGATAATIGSVVVSRRDPVGVRLLAHEACHVRQQERLGLLFAPAYAAAQALWGYRDNPFEVAARRAAAEHREVPVSAGPGTGPRRPAR